MLRVWYDGSDTVVAESAEDAAAVWSEFMGAIWDYETAGDDYEWVERDDWWVLSIRFDCDLEDVPEKFRGMPSGTDEGGAIIITATCYEWVKFCGRGWLCSENI